MLQKKTLPIKGGTVLVAMDGAEPPMSSNSADFSAVEVSVTETLQSCLHPHPHPIYNPRNFLVDASKTFQRHILVSKDNSHKKEMQDDATLESPCKISWTHHMCSPVSCTRWEPSCQDIRSSGQQWRQGHGEYWGCDLRVEGVSTLGAPKSLMCST